MKTITQKHPSAVQGRIVTAAQKRKAGKLASKSKKGRGDTEQFKFTQLKNKDSEDSYLSSDLSSQSSFGKYSEMGSETNTDFTESFSRALDDDAICSKFCKMMERVMAKPVEEITERIEDLEIQNVIRDGDMAELQNRVDDLEQKERATNLIATGLPITNPTPAKTAKKLSDMLGISIKTEEIMFVVKLGNRASDDKTLTKIAFTSKQAKNKVYKAKKKLKGKETWLTEDLTIQRSKLAYQARLAVKKKHAHATWTDDGRVLVMKDEKSKPKRVSSIDELVSYLEIEPLMDDVSVQSD